MKMFPGGEKYIAQPFLFLAVRKSVMAFQEDKMSKFVVVMLLTAIVGLTGCSTREVAAGAVGAGAGYILSKELDD